MIAELFLTILAIFLLIYYLYLFAHERPPNFPPGKQTKIPKNMFLNKFTLFQVLQNYPCGAVIGFY